MSIRWISVSKTWWYKLLFFINRLAQQKKRFDQPRVMETNECSLLAQKCSYPWNMFLTSDHECIHSLLPYWKFFNLLLHYLPNSYSCRRKHIYIYLSSRSHPQFLIQHYDQCLCCLEKNLLGFIIFKYQTLHIYVFAFVFYLYIYIYICIYIYI